jgi:hypothetical protein
MSIRPARYILTREFDAGEVRRATRRTRVPGLRSLASGMGMSSDADEAGP